ncbi:MAG: Cache 3/Cache 2 fusion domain-containing protein [Spirochaetes bacterium]|nr:Cache 3/Cache 2 fusion domain-containing protein [Spirochaetota bacterium]
MNIQKKILSVTIPLIVFPLLFIAVLSTKTANDGITKVAKEFLSFKLEDMYKNISYQYDILEETNLLNDQEMLKKTYDGIEEYSRTIKLSKTGYIEVISFEGFVVISPRNKGANIKNSELFNKIIKNEFGWIEYKSDNVQRVGMYISFSPWKWYIVISEEAKTFYSETEKIRIQILVVGIITIIFIFLVLSFVISKITFPIKALNGTINDIIETNDLNKKVKVYYNDEIGNLSASFNIMIESLNQAYNAVKNYAYKAIIAKENEKRVRTVFQKYVPKEVVDQMLKIKSTNASILIGNKQICTILFSDIRDFTTISESMKADELVKSLNRYFNFMVDKIIANNGIIDKFIGDAIMAVFGAPIVHENDALNCVKAGFQMIEVLKEFNKQQEELGKVKFKIGVGISTGEVIAGNIGSEQKVDYTVIGDPVNTASRLEGLTKAYKVPILISEYTKVYIEKHFPTRELDLIRPKGKNIPFAIYQPFEKIDSTLEKVIELYKKGLSYYKSRDWDKAINYFAQAYEINEDGPSLIYIDRCKYYKDNPPPSDWDGVYVFHEK